MSDPAAELVARLDALPPLRDVISQNQLRAEKKLGQNFILDLNITDKIARAAGDMTKRNVVEIGPGPGGLTRSLLRQNPLSLTAVEFDTRAVAALGPLQEAGAGKLSVVTGDALRQNLLELVPAPRGIVANLPYNIATPLLTGWLEQLRNNPGCFDSMVLMFQREVAMRITATPADKEYGRLAIITQWLCDADRVFDLPPSAFVPPPSVTSSVVRFFPKTLPADAPPFAAVEKITAAAFGQRRKMLKACLKPWPGLLEKAGIDGTKRAEQLPVSDFIKLAQAL
ncbi:MAG: Dimethyladenosine transferase [Micavibrio sp.]|nr:Dimethyladenosine transferase [Micavibrio sp.]